jgi:catechol 2,3-dioxygenase
VLPLRRGVGQALQALGILRLSHLELRAPDLELATAYYAEVLGLVEVERGEDHVLLKCWDERDHHSLDLRGHPSPGLEHLAFKVEEAADLEELEAAAERYGCSVRRLAADAEPGQGQAVRIRTPSGHDVELVHAMAKTGSLLPRVNPPPEPQGLLGIHPPRLDHVQLTAEDVTSATAFFTRVLGFRLTERLVSGAGALLGAWLERSHTPHDVAITRGQNGGLHHFGYWVDDWDQLRRAADVLAYNGVHIETGPTRHGVTRSLGIHFFDPFGTRNEVFTGGYRPDPDDEPTTWTEEEIGRAFFHYRGQLDPRFLAARR